jgi:hypothetical protein
MVYVNIHSINKVACEISLSLLLNVHLYKFAFKRDYTK